MQSNSRSNILQSTVWYFQTKEKLWQTSYANKKRDALSYNLSFQGELTQTGQLELSFKIRACLHVRISRLWRVINMQTSRPRAPWNCRTGRESRHGVFFPLFLCQSPPPQSPCLRLSLFRVMRRANGAPGGEEPENRRTGRSSWLCHCAQSVGPGERE